MIAAAGATGKIMTDMSFDKKVEVEADEAKFG